MKRVLARDLMLGDRVIVEPGRGDRAFSVVRIQRVPGKLPIEVEYSGKGTWHYGSNETVLVRA